MDFEEAVESNDNEWETASSSSDEEDTNGGTDVENVAYGCPNCE